MSEQPVKLLLVTVEPHLHVLGDAIKQEGFVAHCEDFLGTVVTRHYHKCGSGVEDVIHWSLCLLAHLGLDKFGISSSRRHEFAGIYLVGKVLLGLSLRR